MPNAPLTTENFDFEKLRAKPFESKKSGVFTYYSVLFDCDGGDPLVKIERDCSTQEITALLSRNCRTPVKRLQHSCQEIAALLSRDCSTLVKRLQRSCQEIAAFLLRNYRTPVKKLQNFCQNTFVKMTEYLNFFLLCIYSPYFITYTFERKDISISSKWQKITLTLSLAMIPHS